MVNHSNPISKSVMPNISTLSEQPHFTTTTNFFFDAINAIISSLITIRYFPNISGKLVSIMNSHISDMISHNLCDISYMKVTNEPFKLEIHLRQDICSEILASIERTLINPPPIQFKCLLSPIPSQESKISDLIALNNSKTRSSKHPNQCLSCEKSFENRKMLMDHVLKYHSVYSWLAESMRITRYTQMICTKCSFTFDSNEAFENHKDSKAGFQNEFK